MAHTVLVIQDKADECSTTAAQTWSNSALGVPVGAHWCASSTALGTLLVLAWVCLFSWLVLALLYGDWFSILFAITLLFSLTLLNVHTDARQPNSRLRRAMHMRHMSAPDRRRRHDALMQFKRMTTTQVEHAVLGAMITERLPFAEALAHLGITEEDYTQLTNASLKL